MILELTRGTGEFGRALFATNYSLAYIHHISIIKEEVMPLNEDLHKIKPKPLSEEEFDEILKEKGYLKKARNEDYFIKRIISFLRKVQKYSAYTLLGFLGIHTTSVIVLPGLGLDLERSQEVFELGRAIYLGIPYFENIAILGSGALHVLSGIGIRLLRLRLLSYKPYKQHGRKNREEPTIVIDETRDDIGLGGLGALFGLNYRKSTISKYFPSMTPYLFSGYILSGLVSFHYYKFRMVPIDVDGDSSILSLRYVGYVLNSSPMKTLGNVLNYLALVLLVLVGSYHIISGILKFRRKFGVSSKRNGYAAIGAITTLGVLSLARLRKIPICDDFMGKLYLSYVNYAFI